MKKILFFVVSLLTFAASAQTYVHFPLTNFVAIETNICPGCEPPYQTNLQYSATIAIEVPTNTIATLINFRPAENVSASDCWVQYPGGAPLARIYDSGAPAPSDRIYWLNVPTLGPATILVSAYSYVFTCQSYTNYANVLCKFEAVNATPALNGFGVQPAHIGANIQLETSTNLVAWESATNGIYSAANQARFFRMNLNVTP